MCRGCAGRAELAAPESPLPASPRPSVERASACGVSESAEPGGLLTRLRADMRAWCVDVAWLPRVPVFALLAYWGVRHLSDAEYSSAIGALNFGLHELGHIVFAAFGTFVGIAGGSAPRGRSAFITVVSSHTSIGMSPIV